MPSAQELVLTTEADIQPRPSIMLWIVIGIQAGKSQGMCTYVGNPICVGLYQCAGHVCSVQCACVPCRTHRCTMRRHQLGMCTLTVSSVGHDCCSGRTLYARVYLFAKFVILLWKSGS